MDNVFEKAILRHLNNDCDAISCDSCPLSKVLTHSGQNIMVCVLLSNYKEEIIQKINDNLFK